MTDKEKQSVKELLDEVKREDELPSNAGNLFRDILRYEVVGWRELAITNAWLSSYLNDFMEDMREELKQKLEL